MEVVFQATLKRRAKIRNGKCGGQVNADDRLLR